MQNHECNECSICVHVSNWIFESNVQFMRVGGPAERDRDRQTHTQATRKPLHTDNLLFNFIVAVGVTTRIYRKTF